MSIRFRFRRPAAGLAVAAAAVLAVAGTAAGAPASAAAAHPAAQAPAPAGPPVIPQPVSMTAGTGQFTLTPATSIAVDPGSPDADSAAQALAAYLRPATGYPLPVATGPAGPGTIALALGSQYAVSGDPDGEGYQLTVTSDGVTLDAATPPRSCPSPSTQRSSTRQPGSCVMAPASHAYLDQKYTSTAPAGLGQTWACKGGCDVDQFYNWDPASYVTGVTGSSVIGVEGALWTETGTDLSQADEMIFPRLPALAEIAWSPQAARTSKKSPAYTDFISRLAAQGPRWKAAGVNYYPTPEVPWP